MIETISKKVTPTDENTVIDIMSNFGWTLKSSQEINTAESHLEGRGDSVYSVTTRENYVKLVFQRDTGMKNYSKIKELETKYTNLVDSEPLPPDFNIISFFILFLKGITPGIQYIKNYKKQTKEYEENYGAWLSKMNSEGKEYLNSASALLT
ncbi:MAG: hypothetical protein IJA86_08115 [Clostridia bacterium]|nr:hypothetical protein [Clostridia bacterium]